MLAYLGWIAAAFLAGFLLALGRQRMRHSLRNHFSRVETFRGRSYREILAIAGTKPESHIQQKDGRVIRVWKETGYCMTLEFDARDICLGVVDEQY